MNNEILLLYSDILGDYFDNLPTKNISKNVNFIPHNIANPLQVKNNTTTIKLKDQEIQNKQYDNSEMEKICINEVIKIRPELNFNDLFDNNTKEIQINSNLLCGYYTLSYIFSHFKQVKYNIQEIKQKLIKVYEDILNKNNKEDYKLRILNILAKQLKKDYVLKIKKGQLTVNSMILNDNYFISQFDVWLLCYINDFPVMLYANKNYATMQLKEKYIITGGNLETDKYLCIFFDNTFANDSFQPLISIIETTIEGNQMIKKNMVKRDLKQHLRKYKLNLIIKK
jgi:hypothetical protein